VLVLILLVSPCFPSNSFAQEVAYQENCFSDPVADQMLVYIERCKILEQQSDACSGGNAELLQQIDSLKLIIKGYQDYIAIMKEKEQMRIDMATMKDDMWKIKEQAYQEQIKAAKPTFMQEVGKYSNGAIIGAILTAIICLL
jgi:GTP1/Obg family GTP-binding protein